MKKLLPVAFGHWMTADVVAFGPAAIFGHVMCSKKFVEQREVNREVHVDSFFFDAVVPMMKAWRDEEFFEDAKLPAEQDHRKHRCATCYGLRSPHRQDRSRAKKLLAALKPTNFNFKAFVPLLLQHKLWPDTPSHHSQSNLHDQALDRKAISQFDADNRLLVENYLGNIQLMEQLTRLNTNLALLKMHLAQTQAAAKSTLEVEVCGLRIGDFKLLTFPGEITVQVGLNIKKAANDDHALFSGYTNGYIYYTPTAKQRLNTGYAQEDCDTLVAPEWQKIFETKTLEVLRQLAR